MTYGSETHRGLTLAWNAAAAAIQLDQRSESPGGVTGHQHSASPQQGLVGQPSWPATPRVASYGGCSRPEGVSGARLYRNEGCPSGSVGAFLACAWSRYKGGGGGWTCTPAVENADPVARESGAHQRCVSARAAHIDMASLPRPNAGKPSVPVQQGRTSRAFRWAALGATAGAAAGVASSFSPATRPAHAKVRPSTRSPIHRASSTTTRPLRREPRPIPFHTRSSEAERHVGARMCLPLPAVA